MKSILLLCVSLVSLAAHADEAKVAVVGPDFWASPRHAEAVAKVEPLAAVVRGLVAEPEGRLQLSYPEGEWGELWGQELGAWLVSLGVSSDRIDLEASIEILDAVQVALILPPVIEQETIAPQPVERETAVPESQAESSIEMASEPEMTEGKTAIEEVLEQESSSTAVEKDEAVVQEQE